jgi:hypothetical protein
MVQLVPDTIGSSSSGSRWYARALTYSLTGRGNAPEEAIEGLRSSMENMYPANSVQLFIRGVNITFPISVSESDFSEWMKDRVMAAI